MQVKIGISSLFGTFHQTISCNLDKKLCFLGVAKTLSPPEGGSCFQKSFGLTYIPLPKEERKRKWQLSRLKPSPLGAPVRNSNHYSTATHFLSFILFFNYFFFIYTISEFISIFLFSDCLNSAELQIVFDLLILRHRMRYKLA